MKFTEAEIRPDAFRKEQARLFRNDIKQLLKSKKQFVRVCCPACASRSAEPAFKKYSLSFVMCRKCSTLFINPRPTPAILQEYYASSKNYGFWNKYIFPATEKVRREKIFRPRAERLVSICRRFSVPTKSLLEVGCGFGTFCEEMRVKGIFKIIKGIEPTPELAATCRNRGFEIIEKPFEKISFEKLETFDVVVSFEVLEHIFYPRRFLQQVKALLMKKGLFVLTCPNGLGFETMILGKASDTFDVEHLNYFNPYSISLLLKKSGFDVLEIQTPGVLDAELVRKKSLEGKISLGKQPFLKTVLIDKGDDLRQKFQAFLANNNLSSHMWVVAQRI